MHFRSEALTSDLLYPYHVVIIHSLIIRPGRSPRACVRFRLTTPRAASESFAKPRAVRKKKRQHIYIYTHTYTLVCIYMRSSSSPFTCARSRYRTTRGGERAVFFPPGAQTLRPSLTPMHRLRVMRRRKRLVRGGEDECREGGGGCTD